MATQSSFEPLKPGTLVRIIHSGYDRARVAEYRGPLGPKGAHIYKIEVRRKPRRTYIEVREDQLVLLDDTNGLPAAES